MGVSCIVDSNGFSYNGEELCPGHAEKSLVLSEVRMKVRGHSIIIRFVDGLADTVGIHNTFLISRFKYFIISV